MKKINWNEKTTEKDFVTAIIILAGIVLIFFIYVNFLPKISFERKINVEVIEITGNCDKCFDIKPISDSFVRNNTNVKSKKTLDYNSAEAMEMIKKYNIKSIPAVIAISKNIGDLDIDQRVFSIEEGYALFDKSIPYIDINSGEIKGEVNLKEIQDTNCKECSSLNQLQKQLENLGVKVKNYEIIDSSSTSGKDMVKENNLTFLPALLISKNIEEYWWFFSQIENFFIEKQDYYIFKTAVSPYKDISTGQIKGIVDITYIENKSCEDCFNVTNLKGSFQGLGVYIDKEKYVDVSSEEGKSLLSRYNITAIPTIILSKGILDYETIKTTLEQVGTFEKDNNFVFRKLDVLKVKYQKLNTGGAS